MAASETFAEEKARLRDRETTNQAQERVLADIQALRKQVSPDMT